MGNIEAQPVVTNVLRGRFRIICSRQFKVIISMPDCSLFLFEGSSCGLAISRAELDAESRGGPTKFVPEWFFLSLSLFLSLLGRERGIGCALFLTALAGSVLLISPRGPHAGNGWRVRVPGVCVRIGNGCVLSKIRSVPDTSISLSFSLFLPFSRAVLVL